MIYNVIKPFFRRSETNIGDPAKTYLHYWAGDDDKDAIVFRRFVLVDKKDRNYTNFKIVKRYKDKVLRLQTFAIKPVTLTELMMEVVNRIKEQQNN